MSRYKYTEDNPLKVFTAFSGYDSQCLALDRIGIPYELVGWSEIDDNAIRAHNALYPQYADRNYGDIQRIDWKQVPDFDLFTFSAPCQDWSAAGLQRGVAQRVLAHVQPSCGNAVKPSLRRSRDTSCLRMSRRSSARNSFLISTSGCRSLRVTDIPTIGRL